MISPLYKSIIGERYNFTPNDANSITSVTHFSLGRLAGKSRLRRFGATLYNDSAEGNSDALRDECNALIALHCWKTMKNLCPKK